MLNAHTPHLYNNLMTIPFYLYYTNDSDILTQYTLIQQSPVYVATKQTKNDGNTKLESLTELCCNSSFICSSVFYLLDPYYSRTSINDYLNNISDCSIRVFRYYVNILLE